MHRLSSVGAPLILDGMSDGMGEYIKRRRAEMGVNQTALAAESGLTKSHLSSIEAGKIAFPNADIRRRLAKALGVSHLKLLVAAGEITEEEIGTAGAVGVIERDPADHREVLIERLRELNWTPDVQAYFDQVMRGFPMDARKIEITSKDQETELRAQVKGGLAIQTDNPTEAYACAKCGNIISFAGPGMTLIGNTVECSVCRTLNRI